MTRPQLRERIEDRISPEPTSGCFLWEGTYFSEGYAAISIRGQNRPAGREYMRIVHGGIPDGMFVLHHCDNRACVNPDHLYFGTQLDNMRDRSRRKRHPHGESCKISVLTESDVIEAKRLRGMGLTWRDIGDSFGVHLSTIAYAVNGKTWAHIKGEKI